MRRVTNTKLFSSKALAETLHQENISFRPQPDAKSPGAAERGGPGGRAPLEFRIYKVKFWKFVKISFFLCIYSGSLRKNRSSAPENLHLGLTKICSQRSRWLSPMTYTSFVYELDRQFIHSDNNFNFFLFPKKRIQSLKCKRIVVYHKSDYNFYSAGGR